MKFRASSHSVFNLKAHLILSVAYRRKAISYAILFRLEQVFQEVCAHYNISLKEFSGEPDHVHLLLEYPPTLKLSDFVKALKYVSSKKIRAEFRQEIRPFLWGCIFWSNSYCIISVGDGANTEIIERYIRGQERPR